MIHSYFLREYTPLFVYTHIYTLGEILLPLSILMLKPEYWNTGGWLARYHKDWCPSRQVVSDNAIGYAR